MQVTETMAWDFKFQNTASHENNFNTSLLWCDYYETIAGLETEVKFIINNIISIHINMIGSYQLRIYKTFETCLWTKKK